MKTSRKAYVVVVCHKLSGKIHLLSVFTNEHAAAMCARQYVDLYQVWTYTRHMNDGRVDLSGC